MRVHRICEGCDLHFRDQCCGYPPEMLFLHCPDRRPIEDRPGQVEAFGVDEREHERPGLPESTPERVRVSPCPSPATCEVRTGSACGQARLRAVVERAVRDGRRTIHHHGA